MLVPKRIINLWDDVCVPANRVSYTNRRTIISIQLSEQVLLMRYLASSHAGNYSER